MITGYGITSKVLQERITGKTYKDDLSRYLKELEYKDISNETEKCSRHRGILCVNSNNEDERYWKSNLKKTNNLNLLNL